MIFIAIVCLIVAFVLLIVSFCVSDKNAQKSTLFSGLFLMLFSLGGGIFSCTTVVKAGNVGIPILFGDVKDHFVPSGLTFINPFLKIEQMSVRTENYWMSHQSHEGSTIGDDSVLVRSANGLQMPVDLSVPYRLIPDTSPWVYRNLGNDYVVKLLRPSLSTAARRVAAHYSAEELYSTKRDEFANNIKLVLEEELTKILKDGYEGKNSPERVLIVSQVLVGHVGIPDAVKNAIESKLKADQEQQAMEFMIMKEKKEAERKRVEAEGIQKFQEIVSKGIDDRLLRWKAIDATLKLAESHNSKTLIIGSGRDGLPILLGNLEGGK